MHKRHDENAKTQEMPRVFEADLGVLPESSYVVRNRAWVLRREDLTVTRVCVPCVELCDPDPT